MLKVYVSPNEIWGFFQDNKKRLKKTIVNIAEFLNDENNSSLVKLYLTEENGCPLMTIEEVYSEGDEEILVKEYGISESDCISVYNKLLGQLNLYGEEILEENIQETISDSAIEREFELKEALVSFLNTLIGVDECEDIDLDDEELTDMLDSIEDMIMERFGYIIYRPTIEEECYRVCSD